MNKLFLAAALVAGGTFGLQNQGFAHGGQYRGPGDTVPPGGGGQGGGGGAGPASGPAGPTNPGPAGPTAPGAPPPGAGAGAPAQAPRTGGAADTGPDLTVWSFWWEFNKEPYLNLKSHIHQGGPTTGSDDFFLGGSDKSRAKDTLKPSEEQIRQKVVPALREALEKETNNDIVTGCLIALAKIGDAATESGTSEFEPLIAKFLADKNQEISETAAVALGILANPNSIDALQNLLQDTPEGRKLVDQGEVNYRTRAFAAYGLGLIGARTGSEEHRKKIVEILRRTIETDNTKSRDLKVSCVIAMGLVPLETIDSGAKAEKGSVVPPEESRLAQLDYLLAFIGNDEENYLVRAHCPSAMARLLQGLPAEQFKTYRERIANDLIDRITKKKEQAEVIQSSILALGLIGTNDGKDPLDKKIRETLASSAEDVSDIQAKHYSMIALAKVGGTLGQNEVDAGIAEASKALVGQLADGKTTVRSWAGLGCGVMAHKLAEKNPTTGAIATLQQAVRAAIEDEKEPSKIGAFAVSAGIMGDKEAVPALLKLLDTEKQEEAKGYVAIGLGLMNAGESVEKIQQIVDDSKYRPDLLKQAAIALGLLGDKDVVTKLITLLGESKSLATQASISTALGFIGDQRSIDPLVQLLKNGEVTERARGFAAVALGIVADKEPLPWNSKIALDLNYRASTQTLTDQAAGTGILDIL